MIHWYVWIKVIPLVFMIRWYVWLEIIPIVFMIPWYVWLELITLVMYDKLNIPLAFMNMSMISLDFKHEWLKVMPLVYENKKL